MKPLAWVLSAGLAVFLFLAADRLLAPSHDAQIADLKERIAAIERHKRVLAEEELARQQQAQATFQQIRYQPTAGDYAEAEAEAAQALADLNRRLLEDADRRLAELRRQLQDLESP